MLCHAWQTRNNKQLKHFRFFGYFCTPHGNDGISRSIGYSNTSVFSIIVMDWNEVWEINETLLYKGIIHFSRSTVKHENDQNCGKALVVCCSVFSEHGFVEIKKKWMWCIYLRFVESGAQLRGRRGHVTGQVLQYELCIVTFYWFWSFVLFMRIRDTQWYLYIVTFRGKGHRKDLSC